MENQGTGGPAEDSVSPGAAGRPRKPRARGTLPRRLCSLADAAAYLSVSDWSVRRMVWDGDLPHVKRGKRILLDLQDLDRWIEREKVRGV